MYPIAKPLLDEAEAKAAQEAILSGWVAQGPRVEQFEADFAVYVGADYACAVSSGTSALHLALLAVGVQPGDAVLTVSHSHIATANSIRYCSAEPVFIDINSTTFNMDAALLERCLAKDCEKRDEYLWYKAVEKIAGGQSPLRFVKPPLGRVAAILAVHQIGFPCDLEKTISLAKAFNLPLVEDAACAIGSEISFDRGQIWEMIGKPHGDIACFSFHPRKLITTGDGGMLTTNHQAYDQQFRPWRQHGVSMPAAARHKAKAVCFAEYPVTGFNYRMTDIQAAVGIEQIKKLASILDRRRQLAKHYTELLRGVPWLETISVNDATLPNWQSYPVQLLEDAPLSQIRLMQYLLDHGISTRRGIMNAHQEPAYAAQQWQLPQSEKARDRTILLPLYHDLTERDLVYIVNTLSQAGENPVGEWPS